MTLRMKDVLPIFPIFTLGITLGLISIGLLPFSPQIGVFINLLVQISTYISARILSVSDTENKAISFVRRRTQVSEEEFRNELEGMIGAMTVDGLVSGLEERKLIKLNIVADKTMKRVVALTAKARYLY